jgi:cytochrome b
MNNKVLVWSSKSRFFHSMLVVSVILAFLTEEFTMAHQFIGYTIFLLLIFRLYYGFTSINRFERLSELFHSPKDIFTFLLSVLKFKEKRYIGHNPMAGLVMFLMLITLFSLTVTGGVGLALKESEGLLSLFLSSNFKIGDIILEIHEGLTKLLLILLFFHLSGVVVSSILTKENLAKSIFVDGLKRREE